MPVHRLLCMCCIAMILSAQDQAPATVVFRHANVIDGVSSQPALDVTIVIRDGRIAGIGSAPHDSASGSVRVGFEADLIIVGDNPLVNINTLGTVLAVIKDGRLVKNAM